MVYLDAMGLAFPGPDLHCEYHLVGPSLETEPRAWAPASFRGLVTGLLPLACPFLHQSSYPRLLRLVIDMIDGQAFRHLGRQSDLP